MRKRQSNKTHARVIFRRTNRGITFVDVPYKFVSATLTGHNNAVVELIPTNGIEGQWQCLFPLVKNNKPPINWRPMQ